MSPPSAPPSPERSTQIAEGFSRRPRSNRRLLRAGVILPSKAASGLTGDERNRNRQCGLFLGRELKLLLSCVYLLTLGLGIVCREPFRIRRSRGQLGRQRQGTFVPHDRVHNDSPRGA